ncbi:iron-containing redox enzyme family protein [Streptomyces sp. Wb2n-11]|uniref:iron-containing redox enzyme family protein n=1 Tax=Streptomyces sp. Wb2n-11 TaxID=1030533 RepID=UPI000A72B5C0|nr:iron-containing redox enzyme family protein [Streptomyces sp. Wb2n-11]
MTATAELPPSRGPLSGAVRDILLGSPPPGGLPLEEAASADPFGDDLQLALYMAYEPHYRGFRGVSDAQEWNLDLLRLRGAMEDAFLDALRAAAPGDDDVTAELDALLVEPLESHGVSHHLMREGTWEQMREYLAHRSLYQLKEADPQAWVIPRLEGQAKASLVAVEFDEFGGGRGERVHAGLFAGLMEGAGLDASYGRYLQFAPAVTLAPVNAMSLFGLRRALRGAMVGNFATLEITSPPGARRMAKALERLGAGEECTRFFTEHIEADAVHEQVMRRDVIGDLLAREPELTGDVAFGIRASVLLESRWEEHVLGAWRAGRSSLRAGAPDIGRPAPPR